MHSGRVVKVRELGRWQTLWLLCRIGSIDVALVLAVELLWQATRKQG